jgi:hypothetical protein
MRIVSVGRRALERNFPYEVVRQFFESFPVHGGGRRAPKWLRGTAEMAGKMFRDEPDPRARPAEEFALLHSLYWMCVNIAEERPLLMLLDDAQWADAPSLRYVEFTCRRLEQLPFMFVVATRMPDEHTPAPLLSLLATASPDLLRAPLSLSAVEQLFESKSTPTRQCVRCARDVTGGNPFLLRASCARRWKRPRYQGRSGAGSRDRPTRSQYVMLPTASRRRPGAWWPRLGPRPPPACMSSRTGRTG